MTQARRGSTDSTAAPLTTSLSRRFGLGDCCSNGVFRRDHAEPFREKRDHWRMVNARHLVALARAGATFINGDHAEQPGEDTQAEAA